MFYDKQTDIDKNSYKEMLKIIGKLSKLFSDDDSPYLAYRIHENCFCRYFSATNLSRSDVSVDAKKNRIGIGLKTWTGRNDQKIAEFGKLRSQYSNLRGIDLVRTIASYRNDRIRFTKKAYGIDELIYHIVKRLPGEMQILEDSFDYIDVEKIKLIENRGGDNNTYFTDSKNIYHFSSSKNTLYMIFDNCELLDKIEVPIIEDPFELIERLYIEKYDEESCFNFYFSSNIIDINTLADNQICLRLYTEKNGIKTVHEKSGLNQWAAGGRKRDPDEVYIPYPAVDRKRKPDFFPSRGIPFDLELPDSSHIKIAVCQDGGKAIMSNPNKDLGKWLLRDLFDLNEYELLTYKRLECLGIDSVIFTKIDENHFSIDFSELGSYEKYYNHEKTLST